jgi:hypothetical protein
VPCPSPYRQLRHAPSLPALLTCVAITYVARSSLFVHRPSPLGRAADPAMAAGAHMLWRLRSSPAESRAPTSVAGAGGACAAQRAVGSHSNDHNRLTWSFLPYVAYIYVLMYVAIISLDVAKVDRGMLLVSQRHVASIFLKLFHLFPDVCCKRFHLDVTYVFTHMLQQYALKYFIYFSLLLQQVFSCCKLQVFYQDIAYVFTHTLQVYVLNISPILDVCCNVIHICCKRMV